MIVIVEPRTEVAEAYRSTIGREGFTVNSFDPQEFLAWFHSVDAAQLGTVEAVVIGDCDGRESITRDIKRKLEVPAIALNDTTALELTLKLFAAGVDDVVRKPVHAREIIARIAAIRRRSREDRQVIWNDGGLLIPGGGQDIEIHGKVFKLPRRELRILEYMAGMRHRRVSRAQIFGAVYGVLEEDVEECVVESHISKLRKKLREVLGHDPIDTQRFLGYQLISSIAAAA
jgi:two-component system, OmpR family, flagellar system response regulator FtcR